MGYKKSHPNGVMMQNGKMMLIKDGKMTTMENEIKMSNGTKVMANGSYMTENGKSMVMKEGQHMDMMGKMMKMRKQMR